MVRRPDLGYRDEGIDFSAPESFEPQRRPYGEARVMPRAAYRSLQFLYLEDEALWTREWVPVGTVHEVPSDGDILPFTLGYHGIHLQRMTGNSFEARFNLAQHGGCRVVPTQCQQGKRTGCSFTSCGYSRDRGPILSAEGQEDTRTMYQYLGLRPERLHPVQVARVGALMFLNVDPNPTGRMVEARDLPAILSDPSATREHREWTEVSANWKLAAQSIARSDEVLVENEQVMEGVRWDRDGVALGIHWLFPNTILLSQGPDLCIVVLQHTAIDQTMMRIEILSREPLNDARRAFWIAELAAAGVRAEEMQSAVPKKAAMDPPVDPEMLELETDPAAWWFHRAFTDRVAAMPRVESDVPIFRNVEHYLI